MKKKTKSLKTLKSALWKLTSQIVRLTSADLFRQTNRCFTCGKVHPITELHAGHFIHNKLDFDFRNLKPQCVHCNLFKHGNLWNYGKKLQKIYGIEWIEALEREAIRKGNDYSRIELLELTERYKKLLADVLNGKIVL